jgi:hypothetical protein
MLRLQPVYPIITVMSNGLVSRGFDPSGTGCSSNVLSYRVLRNNGCGDLNMVGEIFQILGDNCCRLRFQSRGKDMHITGVRHPLTGAEQVLKIINYGLLECNYHRLPRPSRTIFGIVRFITFICVPIMRCGQSCEPITIRDAITRLIEDNIDESLSKSACAKG